MASGVIRQGVLEQRGGGGGQEDIDFTISPTFPRSFSGRSEWPVKLYMIHELKRVPWVRHKGRGLHLREEQFPG